MTTKRAAHHLASYYGDIKNGRMEGKGIYWFNTDVRYEGEFKDGMFHGKGESNGAMAARKKKASVQ